MTWSIYRIAAKGIRLGTVEAPDAATAIEKAAAEFKVLANRLMAIRAVSRSKGELGACSVRQLEARIAARVPKRGSDPRAAGLAGTRCGRGLNTPHHLTVFSRPSSRVTICGGQRKGFQGSWPRS
jgi:hypothetical protein